jgi:2-C-methyl-D-erythritol 4-phosphate cytidylyltransferase
MIEQKLLDPYAAGAVIVAAGRSERMGGVIKPWAPLIGEDGRTRPLLAYPLRTFASCSDIRQIALVVASDAVEQARELIRTEGIDNATIVAGGARRQDSVRAGLEALDLTAIVIVHDGARPLVTTDLIEQSIEVALHTGAACCAVRVPDTVKEADDLAVTRTLDRSNLWLAQTPQAFRYDLLMEAHKRFEGDASDDASMVESFGIEVRLFEGWTRNMKVTTQDDLALVQALLRQQS